MARPKGQPKLGGRQKGTPNKSTATMKEAITSVYAALQQDSGKEHGHFLAWAVSKPSEFYSIAAKLLPLQLSNDPDAPIVIQVVRFGDNPPPE